MRTKIPFQAVMTTAYRALNLLIIFVMLFSAPLNVYAFTDTDKDDYAPGETVTIFGDNRDGIGYLPGETVAVEVYGPPDGGYAASCSGVADENGAWSCQVTLPTDESAIGLYFYITLGLTSGVSEQGDFTDLAIGTYDQCSNDDGDGYASGNTGCRWINGNLQRNNSTYYEGDATVQRVWLTELEPGSNHTLRLKYGTTKGAKHAYDYLTIWDYSEDWITEADRCEGIQGCLTAPEDKSELIPLDDNAMDVDAITDERYFIIRGGTIDTVDAPKLISGEYGTGDTETIIDVPFKVANDGPMCSTKQGVTTCGIAIWFGAHVALTYEWLPKDGQTGAGGISGSPYHVALDALDGDSIGQRDNQMAAEAIVPNGTIVIIKDAVPDHEQDFEFWLRGGVDIDQVFFLDDDADITLPNTATYSLPPGTYQASEINLPTGWVLTGLTCMDPTSNTTVDLAGGTATINLASAETVTCTYTDTLGKGKILVDKVTDPAASPVQFEFDPSWGDNFFLKDSDPAYDSGDLMPGTYSVAEVNIPSGWSLSNAVCSDGSPVDAINLAPFETVTCTFYDTLARGHIIVDKVTAPSGDPQQFEFDPSWGDNFFLADATTPKDSGALLPGVYSVAEVNIPAGWDLTNVACASSMGGSEDPAAINLDPGETVTCTYTDTKRGKILVDKVTVPAKEAQEFEFDPSWGDNFKLTDESALFDSGYLLPGTYGVTEVNIPAGWDLTSAVCSDGSAVDNIKLDPGEVVTCTFTNTKRGKIIVEKQTIPDLSEQLFSFTPSYASPFQLKDGQSNTSAWLQPGVYSVAETVPAGWYLASSVCSDGSKVDAINLAAGETVTCVFTNWKVDDLAVIKTAVPTFERTWEWTIDKEKSATYNLFAGGSVTHDYIVSVTPKYTDSKWVLTGKITITNPNLWGAFTANVSDAVDNGGTCVLDDPDGIVTVPAGGSIDVGYTCTWAAMPTSYTGINTATVTWDKDAYHTPTGIAFYNKNFEFKNPVEINPVITVDDTNLTGEMWSADRAYAEWTYTKDFTCSTKPEDYKDGKYSYDLLNTAKINETGQSDTAKVDVNCYAPVVSKTAETYWNRDWDWTIVKDWDKTYNLFAGGSVTHNYKVSVTPKYTDNFWGVKGSITVVNYHPTEAMTLTSLTDLAGGINAPVTCPSLVVPAAGSLTCTYDTGAQDKPDANPFGATNIATAAFAGANWIGQKAIVFSATPTTEDEPVITVDDTNLTGEMWSANRAYAEWTYTKDFACSTKPEDYKDGKYSYDLLNTAKINETGQSDTAKVIVNCYAPMISKTAYGTYDERHEWTIKKIVTPPNQNAFAGAPLSYEWKVDVTEEVFEENFKVTGTITVVNPSLTDPMIANLSDMLGDGTVPVITKSATCDITEAGVLTIPVNTTALCDYSAVLPYTDHTKAPTQNTGKVVINDIEFTTTVDILWTKNPIRESATVTDDQIGLNEIISDSSSFTKKEDYTCSTDSKDYAGDGTYTFSEKNTAIVSSGGAEEDRASATETINCYGPVISKTAAGSYDERHEWNVVKTVDPLSQSAFAGDTVNFTWTIVVTENVFEENFLVDGIITVLNPAPMQMVVDLADVLDVGTVAAITPDADCDFADGKLTLAAGATATCPYTAKPDGYAAKENKATATLNAINFVATDPVEWTPKIIRGEAILTDIQGPINETITQGGTWTIKDTYTCSTDETKYSDKHTYSETIFNTAIVTSEDKEEDSSTSSTKIDCYTPKISKTADGTYDERHEWDVQKSVNPVSQSAFAGDTVSYEWTVTVKEEVFEENFKVAGAITVQNLNPEDALTVALKDSLDVADPVTITGCTGGTYVGGMLTVPAGGTAVCDYTAAPVGRTAKLNTATATLNDKDYIATDPVEWTPKVIRGTVQLDDDQNPDFPLSLTDGGTWKYSEKYTCSSDKSLYEGDWTYDFGENNKATIKEGSSTLDEASASTKVSCYIPDITKKADGTYDERHDWDVEKTVNPSSQSAFAGQEVSYEWTITVSENIVEEKFKVAGTITVKNHNAEDAMTVALKDSLDVADPVTIVGCTGGTYVGGMLTIPAGGSAVCDYTASPVGRTAKLNTATATLNSIDYVATDPIEWTPKVIHGSVELDDNQNPALPKTISDGGTWKYSEKYTCSTDKKLYEGDWSYDFSENNLATLYDGSTKLDEDSASTKISCYIPDISKTAAGAYDERHEWDVQKTATPVFQNAFAGEKVSYEWTVKVTESVFEEKFGVTGKITVVNPNMEDVLVADLSDWLSDMTVAAITPSGTCDYTLGKLTVPAGATAICDYTAAPAGRTATLNNAKLSAYGVEYPATAPINWAANVIRGSVKLDDDQNPAFPLTITDGGTWKYTENYTCSTDKAAYGEDLAYDFMENNLATIYDGDKKLDEASASTKVSCYIPDISKTAVGSFERTYKWLISKGVTPKEAFVYVGESVPFYYTVTVTPNGYTDSGFVIAGMIKVTNPHPMESIVANITDYVDIPATCTVKDGTNVTIPAKSFVEREYTCTGDALKTATKNTAKADWTAYLGTPKEVKGSATVTVPVVFPTGPAKEYLKTITVKDDKTDPANPVVLGTAYWPDGPKSFKYTLVKVAEYNCKYYTNKAWIVETGQFANATIKICGQYWGFTPGFWKNHTTDPRDAWKWTQYSTTDLVGEVFNPAYLTQIYRGTNKPLSQYTLLDALGFKGGSDIAGAKATLLRVGVASLLNASFHETLDVPDHPKAIIGPNGELLGPDGIVYFPYSSAKVIELINAAMATNNRDTILALAARLDGYNNGSHEVNWDWPAP